MIAILFFIALNNQTGKQSGYLYKIFELVPYLTNLVVQLDVSQFERSVDERIVEAPEETLRNSGGEHELSNIDVETNEIGLELILGYVSI
ncbi:10773_t:CDS:2 [Funneliformis mosseae]|uniref:10773_t:CDS:1 n=1 Tax=Funneliformis mosseae TaxID=27381 RepID=A0A9N8ZU55_FUNMO|nr:10773_t:CDS:2 [Funneliformis mosseae]